ncbi:hydrogenase expression/formation protein HypE [Clostridium lundense]|uniref:hydrogenase expression/formation protein HypE n=1 Tax=Clostridium lundense TaxID=319475 RepID=UPI0004829473|nr:hydrogenase expression/formation protein HypE [Clostridium lundense]
MENIISMSYGNGGKKTSMIIEEMIIPALGNDKLNVLGDGALLNTSKDIAFSSDSFVIYPYFFPGGDIGKLSVCGTVNDLLMCGSIPKYLSLSFILEEGLNIEDLKKIILSIKNTAEEAEVQIVTGDTKVVDKGHGHGIYINTSGIGEKIKELNLGKKRIKIKDKVILTGSIGNHGISILCARENLLESKIKSDCAPLNKIAYTIFKYGEEVKILRDPTRGGVATTLKEFVEEEDFSIEIEEKKIPVDRDVAGACELLGLDPLYIANEGKMLAIVSPDVCDYIIKDLKDIGCSNASVIGEVVDYTPSKVLLKTLFGGRRILDKITYDLLPRIC